MWEVLREDQRKETMQPTRPGASIYVNAYCSHMLRRHVEPSQGCIGLGSIRDSVEVESL